MSIGVLATPCNILGNVMKQLHDKSRNLNYNHHKSLPFVGEVSGANRNLTTWRHTVDLTKQECSCNEWQLIGLPCRHAISFIGSLREVELEGYVSPYYSVACSGLPIPQLCLQCQTRAYGRRWILDSRCSHQY